MKLIVKARIILVLVSLASGFWHFYLYVCRIRISNDVVFALGNRATSLLFGNYPAGFNGYLGSIYWQGLAINIISRFVYPDYYLW